MDEKETLDQAEVYVRALAPGVARVAKLYFDAFLAVGFSRAEALELTVGALNSQSIK